MLRVKYSLPRFTSQTLQTVVLKGVEGGEEEMVLDALPVLPGIPCSVHAFCLAEAALDDCGPGATLLKLQCFTQMPGLLEGYQSIEPNTEIVTQTPLEGNGESLLQNQLLFWNILNNDVQM